MGGELYMKKQTVQAMEIMSAKNDLKERLISDNSTEQLADIDSLWFFITSDGRWIAGSN